MNAAQYCADKGRETISGRITFTKRDTIVFLNKYTELTYDELTDKQIVLLKGHMVDLYNDGIERVENRQEQPLEKIELPSYIFKI